MAEKQNRVSRRTFLRTVSASTTAILVAACAVPTPSGQNAGGTASQAQTNIRFSGWGPIGEQQLHEDIAENFMEENPTISVEVIHIPQSGEYHTKILTMIAAGNPPDCMRAGTWNFSTYLAEGALLDLTDYFQASEDMLDDEIYFTQMYEMYKSNEDKYYGSVVGPNVTSLFYNMNLFDEAGLPYPDLSWDWDDYVDAANELTVRDGDRISQFGSDNLALNRQNWQGMIWSMGGKIFDSLWYPTECYLDSEEAVETFQWMQDLVLEHRVAPTAAEGQAFEGGFASGRIAMYVGNTFVVSEWSKIDAFEWDMFHVPTASERICAHSGGGVLVSAGTEHPDAAWLHTKYHQSDRAQELRALDGLSIPMMRKWATSDVFLNLEGGPEHHDVRIEALDYSRLRDFYFPTWREVQTAVWAPEIEKLMLNSQTAQETGQNMAEGTRALLQTS